MLREIFVDGSCNSITRSGLWAALAGEVLLGPLMYSKELGWTALALQTVVHEGITLCFSGFSGLHNTKKPMLCQALIAAFFSSLFLGCLLSDLRSSWKSVLWAHIHYLIIRRDYLVDRWNNCQCSFIIDKVISNQGNHLWNETKKVPYNLWRHKEFFLSEQCLRCVPQTLKYIRESTEHI